MKEGARFELSPTTPEIAVDVPTLTDHYLDKRVVDFDGRHLGTSFDLYLERDSMLPRFLIFYTERWFQKSQDVCYPMGGIWCITDDELWLIDSRKVIYRDPAFTMQTCKAMLEQKYMSFNEWCSKFASRAQIAVIPDPLYGEYRL